VAKILVVDDSNFQRNQILRAVKDDGYEIVTAENGKIGFDLFEEHNPDCVLTDLNMPEMDGLGLLQLIRKKNTEVPVIVLSSDTQELTAEKCRNLGASGYMNKPFKKDQLKAVLEKALNKE
jgi:CheY-like chemotaxis protein